MKSLLSERYQRRKDAKNGFSVLEVLAAVAVLSVLLIVLVQILTQTLQATRTSNQQMSAAGQARVVLDAIGNDLSNLVNVHSLSVFYKLDADNNIELAFLTRARRPVTVDASDFRVASVVYRLKNNHLERETAEIPWEQPLVNLVLNPGNDNTLANGILRMEVVAVLDDGRTIPLEMSAALWNSDRINSLPIPNGFRSLIISKAPVDPNVPRVQAITIAVATMDEQTLQIPGSLEIAEDLPSPSQGSNKTPYEVWSEFISSGSMNNRPAPARAGLHIAQRTFPLK